MSNVPGAIDPALVDQAAHWLVRMHAGDFSERERAACEQWRNQSPEHQRIWHSAELLGRKFGLMPPALGMPVLGRRRTDRRAIVGAVAALVAMPPVLWYGYRTTPWAAGPALTYRTGTGERQHIALADGTQVDLNTASAIEVALDAQQRLVRHRGGEILVTTAPDPGPAHRPFTVHTEAGDLRALGTRFVVRSGEDGSARVAVLEGAVEIRPSRAAKDAVVVRAGQQARFTREQAGTPQPLDMDMGTGAWAHGTLYAQEMPLADFLAELSRYRSGVLRCDPAVAQLRVSGAFQIDDTDRVLAVLAQTLPVRIDQRTRYWVTVAAR